MPFSIQLYTVRKALEEDLAGTIRRLADIGFTMIEPYHFVAKAAELKRAMAETFHILDTMASISESIDTRAFVSVESSPPILGPPLGLGPHRLHPLGTGLRDPQESMQIQETTHNGRRPLGVAMIGYAFMGKAHSNAWRNVASYFEVRPSNSGSSSGGTLPGSPTPQRGTAGRIRHGLAGGYGPRRHPDRRHLRPRLMHAEIAIAALAAASTSSWRSGWRTLLPRPKPWPRPPATRSPAESSRWSVSTTAGSPPWPWPAS